MAAIIRLAIGIPTRNRADLAMAAVDSVARAGHRAVTVVVSDNSTDEQESRQLAEFCARTSVEYVRPPEPLPMAAHWEWLRRTILDRTSATHIAYLTDRMVFVAGALTELLAIVERHPDRVLAYWEDRVEDIDTPVKLVQSHWTGQLVELDARRLIELSSRAVYGDYLPRMLNSIVPVAVLRAIEERFGSVFESVAPDYAFAYRCLAVCESVLLLDRACLIQYAMTRSAGISYLRGKPNAHAADFARNLVTHRFPASPEPAFETTANAILNEYCAAREQAGAGRFPPLDRHAYLRANAVSASRIEDDAWRSRMQELLRAHGWSRSNDVRHVLGLTMRMAGYFIRHPGAFARGIRRQLWERPPGTFSASLLPRLGIDPRLRDDLMFDGAAEAIAHADAHPRARSPSSWQLHQLERAGAVRRVSAPARR